MFIRLYLLPTMSFVIRVAAVTRPQNSVSFSNSYYSLGRTRWRTDGISPINRSMNYWPSWNKSQNKMVLMAASRWFAHTHLHLVMSFLCIFKKRKKLRKRVQLEEPEQSAAAQWPKVNKKQNISQLMFSVYFWALYQKWKYQKKLFNITNWFVFSFIKLKIQVATCFPYIYSFWYNNQRREPLLEKWARIKLFSF